MNFSKYLAIFPFCLYNKKKNQKRKEQMIKYFKENLSSISKLFINHVGMTVFALVVLITSSLLSSKLGNNAVFYIMGGLTVLMYFSLIYTAMWERGAKDKIKVDGGRMKRGLFHGLYMYLMANALSIFFALLTLLFACFANDPNSGIYGVYDVFKLITHFWGAIYLPITKIPISSPVLHSLLYFAIIVPGAIVSCVSYILGVKGVKCIFPEPKHDKTRKFR